MKYIIIGYTKPNIKTLSAKIRVCCETKTDFGDLVWFTCSKKELSDAKLFDSRSEAEEYLVSTFKNINMDNLIVYGVEEENLKCYY